MLTVVVFLTTVTGVVVVSVTTVTGVVVSVTTVTGVVVSVTMVTVVFNPLCVPQIKRCFNANNSRPSKNRLTTVQFHPSAQVVLTAGLDRSVSLFQVRWAPVADPCRCGSVALT